MKVQVYLPEEEMVQRALDALLGALGPVEATRFLALPRQRLQDSVERHRQWQATLDRDRFFEQVFAEMDAALARDE